MPKDSSVSARETQVQKIHEYEVFKSLVANGLWKNNVFIADVVGVDRDTIAEWKTHEEVKLIRQEAIQDDLKKWKRTADAEKRLKEQGMDFDAEKLDVSMKIEVIGLENI